MDAYDAVSFDVMGRLHRDERESGTITLLHSLFAAFLEHRGPSGIGRIFIAGVRDPRIEEEDELGRSKQQSIFLIGFFFFFFH